MNPRSTHRGGEKLKTLRTPPPHHAAHLFRGHKGGVALVADALEGRSSPGAAVAPAPPGLELPHVRAARRAHQLQAGAAMVPSVP